MNQRLLCMVILLTLIVGCANSNFLTPTIDAKFTQQPTPKLLINSTQILSSTPSISPFPVTLTPTQRKTDHCLNIGIQDVNLLNVAKGTVLLGKLKRPLYLLDLESQTRYNVPVQTETENHHFYGIHTSTNKQYLAYIDGFISGDKWDKLKIWVIDAKGTMISNKSIDSDVLNSGWRWLNNEQIQILFKRAIFDSTVTIYNPFKQTLKDVANNLPDFYRDYSFRQSNWLVEYNSDMNWVVYLGHTGDVGVGPVLLDLTTHKILWKDSGFLTIMNQPIWSPASEQFALIFEKQLYIINLKGIVKFPSYLGKNDEITQFAWSPDGRYISIWVIHNKDIKANLMLYDVQTGQLVDYCVASFANQASLVWSPDSKQFITSMETEKADSSVDEFSLLVDIQDNVGYRISKDMEPIEWMNSAP